MYTVTKSIIISASHSLIDHVKCGRMHGHNYIIEVTIGSESLSNNGMIIDFGDLKKILHEVFSLFDHKHLGKIPKGWSANPEHLVSLPFNDSTAENLCRYWGELVQDKIKPLKLVKIEVQETPTSKATWIPERE